MCNFKFYRNVFKPNRTPWFLLLIFRCINKNVINGLQQTTQFWTYLGAKACIENIGKVKWKGSKQF